MPRPFSAPAQSEWTPLRAQGDDPSEASPRQGMAEVVLHFMRQVMKKDPRNHVPFAFPPGTPASLPIPSNKSLKGKKAGKGKKQESASKKGKAKNTKGKGGKKKSNKKGKKGKSTKATDPTEALPLESRVMIKLRERYEQLDRGEDGNDTDGGAKTPGPWPPQDLLILLAPPTPVPRAVFIFNPMCPSLGCIVQWPWQRWQVHGSR